MKLKLKRTLAFALAFMMSISSVAFADGTKVGTDGKGTTPVLVEQEATNFDVVIPLTLPVEMDGDGIVTTSNNAKIMNKSFGPIQVENIELQNKDWKLIKFDSDLSKLKIGSNQIGFKIGTDATTDNGDFTFTQQDDYIINGGKDKAIDYNAILSPVRNKVEDINAIDTIFTIDWYEEEQQVAPALEIGVSKMTKTILGKDYGFTYVGDKDGQAVFMCDTNIENYKFDSSTNNYDNSALKTRVATYGSEYFIPTAIDIANWTNTTFDINDGYADLNSNSPMYDFIRGTSDYWTSSAYPGNTSVAYYVYSYGDIYDSSVRYTLGVRPCFTVAK